MRDRLALTLILAALTALLPGSAAGQTQSAENSVSGAAVYEENCEMCHEVGGVGIPEEIPPLVGNPNIDDLEYLARVILEGVSGPIEIDRLHPGWICNLDVSRCRSVAAAGGSWRRRARRGALRRSAATGERRPRLSCLPCRRNVRTSGWIRAGARSERSP